MSAAAWAMLSGALIGLSIVLLVARMLPAHVDAADALARMSPGRHPESIPVPEAAASPAQDAITRLGNWGLRVLPSALWVRTPHRELALLRTTPARFCGDKLRFALAGLVIPPLLSALFAVFGLRLPLVVVAIGSLAVAVLMFFIPDYNALDDARRARTDFRRALTAFTDLVALERAVGSGVRQAMEHAAVADSWVFDRLAEELARSRWSGLPPWDALQALADELGVPELDDVADILRLSGTEGAAAWSTLRARSTALRTTLLNDDLAAANAVNERLSIPGSLLGIVFMALLIAPPLLGMITRT